MIVSDCQQAGAMGGNRIEQQLQDLPLVAWIQVACGLVGQDEFRRWQQCPADGNALPFAL